MSRLCAGLSRQQATILYKEVLQDNDTDALRRLCREDLFFLIYIACKRPDVNRDWLYDRCREVEADPDGYLDLWSREHYKSTIITFGLTIQDILNYPEITCGIFSHTRPIAKGFLTQIKREFEMNTFVQGLFPDILYANPQKESPRWSLDDGIIVKRKSNPKESTVEAWGLVDGQPTSKHYNRMIYDDVVTLASVTTPEMIKKVTDSWALSLNLEGADCKKRYIGTRYHANDTYKTIIDRKAAIPRLYPATDDGTFGGKPVLMTQSKFDEKVEAMGSYVASCQLLQNPLADNAMGFKLEWIMRYDYLNNYKQWNFYILCDPASKKKATNDYTVFVVLGLAPDNSYYLVDGIRDRLNLTERTKTLFDLHRKWLPKGVGYEEYALSCDIEHIQYIQEQFGYRFNITPLGGPVGKNDRIRRLVPLFEFMRIRFPHQLLFVGRDNRTHDFVDELITDEYETFPVSTHDDMLDCMARITEPELMAVFPLINTDNKPEYANSTYNVLEGVR